MHTESWLVWSYSCALWLATLVSGVGFAQRMAQSLDIPLPEITIENLSRAGTRFVLVATAKKWGEEKQLVIIPTLLRGRLVDYYTNLEEEEKDSIQ